MINSSGLSCSICDFLYKQNENITSIKPGLGIVFIPITGFYRLISDIIGSSLHKSQVFLQAFILCLSLLFLSKHQSMCTQRQLGCHLTVSKNVHSFQFSLCQCVFIWENVHLSDCLFYRQFHNFSLKLQISLQSSY